jgi:hypothetical protein
MSMKRLEELSRKIEKNGTMEYRSQLLVEYWTTASLMIKSGSLIECKPAEAVPAAPPPTHSPVVPHPTKSRVVTNVIESGYDKWCAYGPRCVHPAGRKIPKGQEMTWLPKDSYPPSLNFHTECFEKWITEPLAKQWTK